jgi:serine/threonine protein kinase
VESGQRIVSPHVVRTLDSGKLGDGVGWLAMEYAAGQSLEDLVHERRGLSPDVAERVLSQLFAALAAAHAVGIVHRDLKPDNVRVAGDGDALTVKVLDFGIAKDFGVSTLSGTTPGLGTPLWTAPEQSRDGYQPVPSADVWALGLLTFFALTGGMYWRHTSPKASMADLAIELVKADIEPASMRSRELVLPGKLPARFDPWFARAVHRDPKQRFTNAAEAWEALAPLLSPPAPSPQPSLAPPEAAAHARSRVSVSPGWFLTLVIVTCFATGLAIYWLIRSMHI